MNTDENQAQRPAVIVPIHNAASELQACLASLEPSLPEIGQLVLIDDASTDAGVEAVLQTTATWRNCTVHRGSRRRGFSRRVNQGMDLAGGRDVVLLNSDTRVSPGWIERLQAAKRTAGQRGKVATVTPLSNKAGPFSLPERFFELNSEDPSALIERLTRCWQPQFPQVPIGHGFCLFVGAQALEEVGSLRAELFPGYGSENDFCLRCSEAGYQHVAADNLIVLHRGAQSFRWKSRWLKLSAEMRLRRRYPQYRSMIGAWLNEQTFSPLIEALSQ